MGQNLQLDPKKRDYVVENGVPVATDRVLEAAYFALTIPQGRWLYGDAGQGSLLYTLQNTNHGPATEQQFATYAEDAVSRQLTAKGQASAAVAGNVAITREGSANQVEIVPAEQQLSSQLNFTSV